MDRTQPTPVIEEQVANEPQIAGEVTPNAIPVDAAGAAIAANLNEELLELSKQIDSLLLDKQELVTTLRQLSTAHDDLSTRYDNSTIRVVDLTNQMSAATGTIQSIQNERDSLKQKVTDLESELAHKLSKLQVIEESAKAYLIKMDTLASENTSFRTILGGLKNEFKQKEEELNYHRILLKMQPEFIGVVKTLKLMLKYLFHGRSLKN